MVRTGERAGSGAFERRLVHALVLLLCVGTLAAKLAVNAPRAGVSHGDVGYYFTLARNLATGRGFVIDYVADWLHGPTGVPAPANTYWMPMPSLVCAAGMAVFGATYQVAQTTMIVATSVLPALAYRLARECSPSRLVGVIAAFLTAIAEPFLAAASVPQTHGPVALIGVAFLIVLASARRRPSRVVWLGALTGLAHMTRSDGVFWLVAIACFWIVQPRDQRPSPRALAAAAGAYLAVMAPLVLHNLASFGDPLPSGLGRVALLRDYAELYALPESLTLDRYLAQGGEAILADKLDAARENAASLALGPATGNRRPRWRELTPPLVVELALVWAGVAFLLRRRYLPIWATLAFHWLFNSFVMTKTGLASIRAAHYAFLPFLFVGAGSLLVAAARRLAPPRAPALLRAVVVAMVVALLAWIGWANLVDAARRVRNGARFMQQVEREDRAIVRELVRPLGLEDAVFLADNVHDLHAHTGLSLVQIPLAPVEDVHRAGLAVGASHVLLKRDVGRPDLPAAGALERSELFDAVAEERIGGSLVRIYRLVP